MFVSLNVPWAPLGKGPTIYISFSTEFLEPNTKQKGLKFNRNKALLKFIAINITILCQLC